MSNFKFWLEYYIRWDQHLLEDPENDSKEILEKFNVKYEELKRISHHARSASASVTISKIDSTSSISDNVARLYERESAMIAEHKFDDDMSND